MRCRISFGHNLYYVIRGRKHTLGSLSEDYLLSPQEAPDL